MHYSPELPAVMDRIIASRKLDEVAAEAMIDASVLSRMRRHGKVPRRATCAQIADNLRLRPGLRRELFKACGYVPTDAPQEVVA